MSVPFATFGPGILILTRTDVSPGTPINVGYAQEFSLEAAGTTKQLYGQNQWPLVAARGTIKATGKIKAATLSGIAANNAFFGMSSFTSTGAGNTWTINSTVTISSASTALAALSTAFDADLGVTYANSGLPFQRVSTGNEAQGKYSVSGGVYTFLEGSSGGANIRITYTSSTGAGQTLVVANQLIGTTPTFQLDYYTNLNQPAARPFAVRIYSAIASRYLMAFKLEDFMMPELDFDLFANAAGNVFAMVFPEVS